MPARSRSNPLSLAVLCSLAEKPMHPYEIASTLRERGKDDSIRLNYGSLYSVVTSLEKRGLIQQDETQQEGRRPERTVYSITDVGRTELADWMTELISEPVKEYPQFMAGISLLPALPPDDALDALRQRVVRLQINVRQMKAKRDFVTEQGLPRLFGLESEYELALLEAEESWTAVLIEDLESGDLDGLEGWRLLYKGGHMDIENVRHLFEEGKHAN